MYNSIREKRIKRQDMYQITLQMPEKDYFNIYDSVNEDAAREILENYLKYHLDDGKVDDIRISLNKNAHAVKINANLHYTDGEYVKM